VAAVCSLTSGGQVTVRDLLVRVGGDLAYTVGIERIEATLACRGKPRSVSDPQEILPLTKIALEAHAT
jgi:ketosteroid isomerase-like protein